jgi:hypothetical protein
MCVQKALTVRTVCACHVLQLLLLLQTQTAPSSPGSLVRVARHRLHARSAGIPKGHTATCSTIESSVRAPVL